MPTPVQRATEVFEGLLSETVQIGDTLGWAAARSDAEHDELEDATADVANRICGLGRRFQRLSSELAA